MPRRIDEKETDKSVLARLEVEESRAPHLQDSHLKSLPCESFAF
jgi:hypothetical protein